MWRERITYRHTYFSHSRSQHLGRNLPAGGAPATWYSLDKKLAMELLRLDLDIAALFRKASRDEADDYERAVAVYLRQTIDH